MEAVLGFRKYFLNFWEWGVFGMLAMLAVKFGGMGTVLTDLSLLFSGDVREISSMGVSLAVLPVICAILVFCFVVAHHVHVMVTRYLGKPEHHTGLDVRKEVGLPMFYLLAMGMSGVEEIIFRWIPLGLLVKLSFLSGTAAFYFLLLGTNILFALLHLLNYTKGHRRALRASPHFLGGILFSYAFVKLGIVGAIFAHCAWNTVAIMSCSLDERLK